jgi:hypothetical protein
MNRYNAAFQADSDQPVSGSAANQVPRGAPNRSPRPDNSELSQSRWATHAPDSNSALFADIEDLVRTAECR